MGKNGVIPAPMRAVGCDVLSCLHLWSGHGRGMRVEVEVDEAPAN